MHELTIEKMAYGGFGFGYLNRKSCFVPFTTIGDKAYIEITDEKRSYLNGKLCKIIEAGPARINPLCPVFGKCGGCNWQHIEYDNQLLFKQNIFNELLWRIGGVKPELILPIVASPRSFGYRSRAQFKVRAINNLLNIGFYQAGTHKIIPLPDTCAILTPSINSSLPEIRHILSKIPDSNKIPQIDVMAGIDDEVIVVFHYIGNKLSRLTDIILHKITTSSKVKGIYIQQGRKNTLVNIFGSKEIHYPVVGCVHSKLKSSAGGFTQINYNQNINIINSVCEWAELDGTKSILDLYCGNGNFSIPLSFGSARLIGIEEYSPSIIDAINNSENQGIKNIQFHVSKVVEALCKLVTENDKFDLVVLDPPRIGAADSIEKIARLNPENIIYVSCDPSTLARDIKIFCKYGYTVIKTRPYDMFPQTYHLESITHLKKLS